MTAMFFPIHGIDFMGTASRFPLRPYRVSDFLLVFILLLFSIEQIPFMKIVCSTILV